MPFRPLLLLGLALGPLACHPISAGRALPASSGSSASTSASAAASTASAGAGSTSTGGSAASGSASGSSATGSSGTTSSSAASSSASSTSGNAASTSTGSSGGTSTGAAGSTGGGTSGGGLAAQIGAAPGQGAAPLAVTFSACGSAAGASPIVFYAWDFGDGEHASGPAPAHTFSAGTWVVTLTVTDAAGASASSTTTVTVTSPPAPTLVTNPAGHPRLFFDDAHKADLLARIARQPILSDPGYHQSYVDGFLLTGGYRSANQFVSTNCYGNVGSSLLGGGQLPAIFQARNVSDCIGSEATGAALTSNTADATTFANAAIGVMQTLANTWPSDDDLARRPDGGYVYGANGYLLRPDGGALPIKDPGQVGFGRWDCGVCATGSNLNNGELLFGVALAFDLLHGRMTAAQRDDVRGLLIREARAIYRIAQDPSTWWSKPTGNNWQAVIAGGLGMAALALQGEPGLAAGEADTWLQFAQDHLDEYLVENFDADGVNYEDGVHTDYGLFFAVEFYAALRNVTGLDLLPAARGPLRTRLQFLQPDLGDSMAADGTSWGYVSYPPALAYASATRDGMAQWMWDHLSGADRPAANDFPWTTGDSQGKVTLTALQLDDTVAPESPEGRLPLGRVYPGFGRAAFRTSFEDPQALFLGVEDGVAGSHGKPNQGHLFFSAYGARLADNPVEGGVYPDGGAPADAGLVEPAYSVVTLDGKAQRDPGGNWRVPYAFTRGFVDAPEVDLVSYDNRKAYTRYPDGGFPVEAAVRDVLFVRPAGGQGGYAAVLDHLDGVAASSHRYTWQLQGGLGLSNFTSPSTGRHQSTAGGVGLEVLTAGSGAVTYRADVRVNPSARAERHPVLREDQTGAAADFVNVLFPTDGSHPLPSRQTLQAGSALGLQVGEDRLLQNPTGASFTRDGVQTDARALWFRLPVAGLAFALAEDATSLALSGQAQVSTGGARLTFAFRPEADGASLWVTHAMVDGGATPPATPATLSVRVPQAGARYVVAVDDAVLGLATSDAAGMLSVGPLDLSAPRAVRLVAAAPPASCP